MYNETWNNPIVIQCGIEPVIDFKGWDSDSYESVSKLDIVQLCETQKVRLFHVMVVLVGLCG